MNLKSIMRFTYLLGWLFAALAVIYRALAFIGVIGPNTLPATSRGVLFFSALLFLASIATGVYEQTRGTKEGQAKGISA